MITNIPPFRIYTPNFTAKKSEKPVMIAVNRAPFTQETINTLADSWSRQDLIYEGDSLIFIPYLHLFDAAQIDKKIAQTLPHVNISQRGFAATIVTDEGIIDTRALQYFDPEVITVLKLVNQIRNNKTFIVPLETQYIDD